MKQLKLLDCTLRDGGYINNWHFGKDVISKICSKLIEARLDIVEIGFLTELPHTTDDSLYFGCSEIDSVVGMIKPNSSMIAAMIAIGEMEMDPAMLPLAEMTTLDVVRITFHNDEAEKSKAFRYAKCLMDKGYLVCMQPVGTTSYTDKALIGLIDTVNHLSPYAFYLVDTLGLLDGNALMRFVDLIDKHLAPQIALGFHSHNNLQLSYANAQCIGRYDSPREFILDCSVYGMGRGAGNLCTELITQYQNSVGTNQYVMMPIYEIIDSYIYPIHLHSSWGYNAHYYMAAVHGCHPSYASFLMNKQTLTMNEVDMILRNIPFANRYTYKKSLIDTMYHNFQSHSIDDTHARTTLGKELRGKSILLLAPGQSLLLYKDRINQYIDLNKPVTISINSLFHGIRSDYLFVSNLKRFYTLDIENLDIPLILTSNLPNIVQDAYYINYASLCDKSNDETDNSGIMALRLMREMGVNDICIAGYDGFSKDSQQNYYDTKLINSVDSEDFERKNTMIRRQLETLNHQMNITSITPSRYLDKGGKYKLVIFDLDGTLADTSQGILECHRFANSEMGKPITDETVLDGIIGTTLLTAYLERFKYSENEARTAVKIYREHYADVGMKGTVLYYGIKECLVKLKKAGYLLAVATLKGESLASDMLEKLEINMLFDLIIGMDEQDSRDKKWMLESCMTTLRVSKEQTILVGDTLQDSVSAKECGISFLGVTYGFGFTQVNTASDVGAMDLIDNCEYLGSWFMP